MKIEISCDDWSDSNLRVAELLKKYGLPCVFYIPVFNTPWLKVYDLMDTGFEIGGHTYNHPMDLKRLTFEEKFYQINTAKNDLEKLINKDVTKFCYPRGRYDAETVQMVKNAGFEEARTTKVLASNVGDKFIKPTTIHFYDRREYDGKDLVQISKEMFDRNKEDGFSNWFHLWFHAWELDKYDLWDKLEEVLKYINENKGK